MTKLWTIWLKFRNWHASSHVWGVQMFLQKAIVLKIDLIRNFWASRTRHGTSSLWKGRLLSYKYVTPMVLISMRTYGTAILTPRWYVMVRKQISRKWYYWIKLTAEEFISRVGFYIYDNSCNACPIYKQWYL